MERAKSRSLMICTPIARNPAWEYTASMLSTVLTLRDHGIRCTFQFVVGSSIVHKARNELVAYFLASDYTDMIFIDDDMEWSPTAVLRLLGSDKPLIGGVGRQRVQKPNSDPRVWCMRVPPDMADPLRTDDMGAVEVGGFGAAFMLINKIVFERLVDAHPEWQLKAPSDWSDDIRPFYFEFFRQGHPGVPGDETGEDYVFCDRWRAIGEEVWVDPSIVLGHVGSFNYRGSVQEVLS
ncbi:hypothetical protein [Rhizobium sp. N324]|uniref:hypothetical protein n=1 Tax=Rhizobium sp. N324 TaxID=1703969 RepID=UPI0007E981BE|nr:hypothetical protein [Rhizobium sp. N324]